MRFVETMQMRLGDAARRRGLSGLALASVVFAGAGIAMGQMKAPRYQSPIEAPTAQPLSLPVPAAITPNGTVVEDVIVRVNDQIVNRSDVLRAEQQLQEDARRSNLSPAEMAQREKDLLRDMIDQQLLLSRGKELDINPDAETIRQLDAIRKQNKLDSMEALEKAVRESGISYEDFKANIRNSIITQQVVRDEVGRNLRLSSKLEQAYYDEHKQDYEQPEQVRLSEILIPTPDPATDAQIAQAQARADEVAAKLKAGAKFEDLAKEYSGGPAADKGGELGEFKRGTLAKVLEDQTFPLKVGESTAPIRTRQGFVVLKVTEHVQAGVPPLKDVEEQVQEAMYQDAMRPALRTYLTGLRENAYIDIAPGFVDSGASAKETKPVYSASTPPQPKKKTVAQKQRFTPVPVKVATPVVATVASTAGSSSTSATPAARTVASRTKPKKIRREKVRFGQAPRNSLPAGPEETLAPGADQGPGATSSALPAPGAAMATMASPETQTVASTTADPLGPQAVSHGKTRFSDRAATEGATKAAAKTAKVQKKIASQSAPLTAEEKTTQKVQDAPLGLSGDTATKKKRAKVKGAPKERMQDQPAAPAAAKPDATPIPPKSVRDNGEPAVAPAPDLGKTPPAALPGGPIDTPPPTPANPAPMPSPGNTVPQP